MAKARTALLGPTFSALYVLVLAGCATDGGQLSQSAFESKDVYAFTREIVKANTTFAHRLGIEGDTTPVKKRGFQRFKVRIPRSTLDLQSLTSLYADYCTQHGGSPLKAEEAFKKFGCVRDGQVVFEGTLSQTTYTGSVTIEMSLSTESPMTKYYLGHLSKQSQWVLKRLDLPNAP